MKKIKEFLAFYLGADQTVLKAAQLVRKLESIRQLENIIAHETALRISYQNTMQRLGDELSQAHAQIQNLSFHLGEAQKRLGPPTN